MYDLCGYGIVPASAMWHGKKTYTQRRTQEQPQCIPVLSRIRARRRICILFFDTLNRSFVLMESCHHGVPSAEYGACRINGDTLVLTPFIYSDTFLHITDYIKANTNFDDEQIKKEIDLLNENNSSDTVQTLFDKWYFLRMKPLDVPVFRSKEESIDLGRDKFLEYRYIMKRHKLINITAKEITCREYDFLLQDLYKVDLPIPPEKEVFRKTIVICR